jgi:hypothetical protein
MKRTRFTEEQIIAVLRRRILPPTASAWRWPIASPANPAESS